jgi:hypothetical protein
MAESEHNEWGNFALDYELDHAELADLDFLLMDIMDEDCFDDEHMGQLGSGDIPSDLTNLSKPAMADLPPPEMPASPKASTHRSRFSKCTDEEVNRLFEARQTVSTKRNTNWGVKIIQGNNCLTYSKKEKKYAKFCGK